MEFSTLPRSKWKVIHYQRALAARGAKVSGRKKELIERLELYERNEIFGATPIIDDSPTRCQTSLIFQNSGPWLHLSKEISQSYQDLTLSITLPF